MSTVPLIFLVLSVYLPMLLGVMLLVLSILCAWRAPSVTQSVAVLLVMSSVGWSAAAVEGKQSVTGKFFNIVIKCGSEKHQIELLTALQEKAPKALIKLLNGADVRTQN